MLSLLISQAMERLSTPPLIRTIPAAGTSTSSYHAYHRVYDYYYNHIKWYIQNGEGGLEMDGTVRIREWMVACGFVWIVLLLLLTAGVWKRPGGACAGHGKPLGGATTAASTTTTTTIRDLPTALRILGGDWLASTSSPSSSSTSSSSSGSKSSQSRNRNTPPPGSARSILEARAVPNARLSATFGITNSFTTHAELIHASFRRLAAQRIKVSREAQWGGIVEIAWEEFGNAWRYHMDISPTTNTTTTTSSSSLCLVDLVQTTVLGLTLKLIFPDTWNRALDVGEWEEAVFRAAKGVNEIWLSSKKLSGGGGWMYYYNPLSMVQRWYKLRQLRGALGRLVRPRGEAQSGRYLLPLEPGLDFEENPLNLLLPSYETMWRVSLLCLLEVYSQREQENRENAGITAQVGEDPIGAQNLQNSYFTRLTSFVRGPTTKQQFLARESLANGEGISCSDIINETLRLYPPTKRIYRSGIPTSILHDGAIPASDGGEPTPTVNIAIDIEHIQRDRTIWGPNADDFQPSRWGGITQGGGGGGGEGRPAMTRENAARKEAFLPFGAGKSLCPARSEFGPMIVAVVVGVAAEGAERVGYVCESVERGGGLPLRNGRTEYEGLRLVPKLKEGGE